MRALSEFLWHERDVLELVLHRLETERALLETGRTTRIALAAREVDAALDQLRTAELARVTEVTAATQVLGLPADSTLRTIAGLAPVPWGDIFLEHHTALRELVDAITAATGDAASPTAEGEEFLDSLREDLEARRNGVSGHAAEEPDVSDSELTDAVIDLQLQEISRQAAEARGIVLQQGLVDFLS